MPARACLPAHRCIEEREAAPDRPIIGRLPFFAATCFPSPPHCPGTRRALPRALPPGGKDQGFVSSCIVVYDQLTGDHQIQGPPDTGATRYAERYGTGTYQYVDRCRYSLQHHDPPAQAPWRPPAPSPPASGQQAPCTAWHRCIHASWALRSAWGGPRTLWCEEGGQHYHVFNRLG
jgi:hypothetical protein